MEHLVQPGEHVVEIEDLRLDHLLATEHEQLPREISRSVQELEPVHVGQEKVLQDQIRWRFGSQRECPGAVAGLDDRETLVAQSQAHELARNRIVFDHQDDSRLHEKDSLVKPCSRDRATMLANVRVSIGLVTYPSQPAASARCSSPFMAYDVTARTIASRVAGSALSRLVSSRPSMPGSWMSIRNRRGRNESKMKLACSASIAVLTT